MSLPLYLQQGAAQSVDLHINSKNLSVPTIHNAEYELALMEVLKHGHNRGDRTGTGTIGLFGLRMEFDLQKGFPLVTTKKVWWKGVVEELLWILRGETNIKSLQAAGVSIWDEWADENGDLGPVYGKQWRSWVSHKHSITQRGSTTVLENPVDQLMQAINEIKGNPDSRRIVVSAWNPTDIPDMALPPCHMMFQFYVNNGYLDCQLYQRSADMFLGVPFNIASYSLLTHIIAQMTGLQPGRFIHVIGDAHIYVNHVDQVVEQLGRKVRDFPTLTLPVVPRQEPSEFSFGDFLLEGYKPHPKISAPVAV